MPRSRSACLASPSAFDRARASQSLSGAFAAAQKHAGHSQGREGEACIAVRGVLAQASDGAATGLLFDGLRLIGVGFRLVGIGRRGFTLCRSGLVCVFLGRVALGLVLGLAVLLLLLALE